MKPVAEKTAIVKPVAEKTAIVKPVAEKTAIVKPVAEKTAKVKPVAKPKKTNVIAAAVASVSGVVDSCLMEELTNMMEELYMDEAELEEEL